MANQNLEQSIPPAIAAIVVSYLDANKATTEDELVELIKKVGHALRDALDEPSTRK